MSKKAKTSGPTDEVEPKKTPEDAGRDTEVVMDDSAPQDPATNANLPEADPTTHRDGTRGFGYGWSYPIPLPTPLELTHYPYPYPSTGTIFPRTHHPTG